MMKGGWKSWGHALREHQAALNAGVDQLETLDRAGRGRAGDATAGHAWEALFSAKPEPHAAAIRHGGRCGICGARVAVSIVVCPVCQATWRENASSGPRPRRWPFLVQAVTISVASGFAAGQLVVWLIARNTGGMPNEGGWYWEFLNFLRTYLWFTLTVLGFLGATLLWERRYERGRWQAAAVAPHRTPGALGQ